MAQQEYYSIRAIKMANYLVRQGFDIVRVVDNNYNKKFKIFLFKDSPELRKAMEEYGK